MQDKQVSRSSQAAELYEAITRRLRWAVILIILITTPLHQPHTFAIGLLIFLACIFNLTRYSSFIMRSRWYSSRYTFLVADNLLVALLLQVVGNLGTPYLLLLPMVAITATYWYGTWGASTVTTFQIALLGIATFLRPMHPLTLGPARSLILAGGLLAASALILEKLTRAERVQRNSLQSLESEKSVLSSRLLALINSLGDAVAAVDASGRITIANAALSELSGTEADLLGKRIATVLPLKHAFKPNLDWSEALRTAPSRYRDYTLQADNANPISVELTISPIPHDKSAKPEYIVHCHDITQDKSLDEQRQEFIAVASHELRTPLAFIEGALSLALSSPDNIADAESRTFLEKAHHNIRFLSSMVDDLTLLARAQNDAIEIQPQVVEPDKLINQLVEEYASQATAKHLSLKTDIKPGIATVLSTEYHIEQIMRNLISNAIKYTKSGEVIVSAQPAQNEGVLFSVRDTGPGISQIDQKKLFTKYFRSEKFQTRETGGTGLGLYISQEVARRIDAKLWCTSQVGHGATFFLEVPPFSRLANDQKAIVASGVSNLVDQI